MTPPTTAFTPLCSKSFTATAGTHTLTIKSLTTGNNTAFLDGIVINRLL